jgi:hypothetical protein
MVNAFEAQPKPEPPSATAIIEQFKAEQAALDRTTEPAQTAKIAAQPSGNGYETISSSVFDRLAELIAWADILEPLGWTSVRRPDASTLEAWKRPEGTHPVSAKVLKVNPHVLVVWSEDAGLPVGAGQKLTKARALAHFHYGGNESAFAKDLVRGEAVGGPSSVNDTIRAEWAERTANVTEVIADQINSSEAAEDGPETSTSSWRPVDLTSVLDGTWQPPVPSVGRRSDGLGLFYQGKTHTVVSETEAGKTWFALAAAIHENGIWLPRLLHRFRRRPRRRGGPTAHPRR